MADDNECPYEVGFRKPPRTAQFRPGQSGNPKGRPRGAKNFATAFQKELGASIEVTENGKRRRITKRVALVKQAVNKAIGGNPRATAIVLAEARLHENQPDAGTASDVLASAHDQLVIESIIRRICGADQQASAAPPDVSISPETPPPADDQDPSPPGDDEGAGQ